jgi:hypothetical protein
VIAWKVNHQPPTGGFFVGGTSMGKVIPFGKQEVGWVNREDLVQFFLCDCGEHAETSVDEKHVPKCAACGTEMTFISLAVR